MEPDHLSSHANNPMEGQLVGRILAVIDQHAADERYRLERLIEQLHQSVHMPAPALQIQVSQKYLSTLRKRQGILRQWGICVTVESSEMGISEMQGTAKDIAVLRFDNVPDITKDLDAAKWKEILIQYLSEEAATQLPSLLMDILASKACRSVLLLNTPFHPHPLNNFPPPFTPEPCFRRDPTVSLSSSLVPKFKSLRCFVFRAHV